jgi:hypothetical protein
MYPGWNEFHQTSRMACSTLLAGDMGGTKTLLALYGIKDGRLAQLHQQRFISSEWTSLEPMLEFFFKQATKRHRSASTRMYRRSRAGEQPQCTHYESALAITRRPTGCCRIDTPTRTRQRFRRLDLRATSLR